MKKKKRNDKDIPHDVLLKRFIVATLRRATLYWKPRNDTVKKARRSRGLYECNLCKKCFGRKEIRLDHIESVVRLSGFTNWDDYLKRMFPPSDGFQVLCLSCNFRKTSEENVLRKIKRSVDKNKKK